LADIAHITRDSDTTFKVKRSKVKVTRPLYSPPCWRVRQLQRSAWERVGRGKLLVCCRLLGRARRFGAHGEERGGGISWRPPAYSLFYCILIMLLAFLLSLMLVNKDYHCRGKSEIVNPLILKSVRISSALTDRSEHLRVPGEFCEV